MQDYNLVSHTIHVVYVNFVHKWQDVHFKVDSERQIFEKLFMKAPEEIFFFAMSLAHELD